MDTFRNPLIPPASMDTWGGLFQKRVLTTIAKKCVDYHTLHYLFKGKFINGTFCAIFPVQKMSIAL